MNTNNLSAIVAFDFRRGNLLLGPQAFFATWPFARATLLPDGLLLQTCQPLRWFGQAVDLRIPYDEIERVGAMGNGVIVHAGERLFPIETSLGPLTGRKRRSYSRVVITIPRKRTRQVFIRSLEEAVAKYHKKESAQSGATERSAPVLDSLAAGVSRSGALIRLIVQLALGIAAFLLVMELSISGVFAIDLTLALLFGLPLVIHAPVLFRRNLRRRA